MDERHLGGGFRLYYALAGVLATWLGVFGVFALLS